MDKLSAMRTYRRIVELGSFRAAAADRGLSNAGVSKQLIELEAELGATLITRTTRKLATTEVGQAYFQRCVRILDDIAESDATVTATQGAPRGLLRVSAPMSFGLMQLMAGIPAFLRQYPQVQLDLVLNDRAIDLIEEGFDVAIRVRTTLADSSLVAKRLGTVSRVVCASPGYLAEAGTPQCAGDLLGHRALVYSLSQSPTEWLLTPCDGGRPVRQRVVPGISINNSIGLRDAALAGMGISLIPTFVIAEELRTGRLVQVLQQSAARTIRSTHSTLAAAISRRRYAHSLISRRWCAPTLSSSERWTATASRTPRLRRSRTTPRRRRASSPE